MWHLEFIKGISLAILSTVSIFFIIVSMSVIVIDKFGVIKDGSFLQVLFDLATWYRNSQDDPNNDLNLFSYIIGALFFFCFFFGSIFDLDDWLIDTIEVFDVEG